MKIKEHNDGVVIVRHSAKRILTGSRKVNFGFAERFAYAQRRRFCGKVRIMYIFLYIVLGGFAGWIASILTHNNGRMGLLANIIVGLIGASLGGLLSQLVGLGSLSIFTFWGMAFAVLGAVVLLFLIGLVRGRHSR